MRIRVVTLFPAMVIDALGYGICGRALSRKLVEVRAINPRDFAKDVHRTVDDRPYGGGPGMVLMYEPMRDAIRAARAELPEGARTVFLSPQGKRLDQDVVRRMATWPGILMVAGRYEGIDERLVQAEGDEEISLGDFVMSGGEIAALAIIDALVRLMPGALGDELSATQDSFCQSLLDHPHYTRPERVDGRTVPEVLVNGNHEAISRWRLQQALGRTFERRPDLLEQRALTEDERRLLQEYMTERSWPQRTENS